MAQIEMTDQKGSKRKKQPYLTIDMTPMVDLAFLLITFFILTTSMSEKKVMKLAMPAETEELTPLKGSHVLTAVLDKNNTVFAYEGILEEAIANNKVISTSYNAASGIRKLIRDKQIRLEQTDKEGKDALIFLIKPTRQASYKNIIDALDETTINNVKKFMLLDASQNEQRQLEKMHH